MLLCVSIGETDKIKLHNNDYFRIKITISEKVNVHILCLVTNLNFRRFMTKSQIKGFPSELLRSSIASAQSDQRLHSPTKRTIFTQSSHKTR